MTEFNNRIDAYLTHHRYNVIKQMRTDAQSVDEMHTKYLNNFMQDYLPNQLQCWNLFEYCLLTLISSDKQNPHSTYCASHD